MIVLRKTLRTAQAEAEKHRRSAGDAEAEAARLRGVLRGTADGSDRWEGRARAARDMRREYLAALGAELESVPQCGHKPWPCARENCSRGRYAAGLARALELAGGNGQAGGDEDGAAVHEAGGEP